jgi:hypothetical protein
MNVESLVFRKLTSNEFKAITNTINSVGGGSQTYIDFPKGCISDDEFKEFFDSDGKPNANGYEWEFYVNSLSLGQTHQKEIISARRSSSNSLREQNKENRIEIWKNEKSGFPLDSYDEKNNPIIVYIIKSDNKEYWAGWFYRNYVNDTWPMTKGLSSMLWQDCAYIKFDAQIPFDVNDFTWPFLKSDTLSIKTMNLKNKSLQQIYYGAPGTGKSYAIDMITKVYDTIRTTFHPDSDYSTFVGAYKPTMTKVELRDMSGHLVKEEGTTRVVKEDRITYKFVKQAFLKAYLSAWKKYAEGDESGIAPQFLVIEEINRGNCAQIFGDLFQLLDRQDNGFSSYPIEADADLQREIAEAFKAEKDYMLTKELNLQGIVKDYVGNLAEDIKSGKILLLPSNFYIWATMNTSDQSLFPIDSAFKRRWDWKYVKIADAKKDYKIKCGDETCDWWTFISAMNEKIADETSSDDKKLGYFFCKPMKEGEPINVERFVSKVMFYLWNDVFKDGNTQYFNVNSDTTKSATFDAFYNDDNTVNVANVRKFIVNIVGEKILEKESNEMPPQEEFDDPVNKIDYTKYSFDGNDRLSKKDLGVKIVEKYINEHADETFADLQKALDFGDKVENKYQYHGVLARTEEVTNSYLNCFVNKEITSSDGVKYKVLSWWNKYNISFIIDFAKQQGWEVTESKG